MAGQEYVPKHKDTICRKSYNLNIMQLYKSCSRKHTCNNVVVRRSQRRYYMQCFTNAMLHHLYGSTKYILFLVSGPDTGNQTFPENTKT